MDQEYPRKCVKCGTPEIERIKVVEIERFRDGGTVKYRECHGTRIFYVDGRVLSPTIGKIFTDYPSYGKAKQVEVILELEKPVVQALVSDNSSFLQVYTAALRKFNRLDEEQLQTFIKTF